MKIDNPYLLGKMLKTQVRIQSVPAGPVWQIWVSGPVRSRNSSAVEPYPQGPELGQFSLGCPSG